MYLKIYQHAQLKGTQKFVQHEMAPNLVHSATFSSSKSNMNNYNQTNISHHDKALNIIDKILSNSAPDINHSSIEMTQLADRKDYEQQQKYPQFYSAHNLNRAASDDILKTTHRYKSPPPYHTLPGITPNKQAPQTPPNSMTNSFAQYQIHDKLQDIPNHFNRGSPPVAPQTPDNSLANSYSANQFPDMTPGPWSPQSSNSILNIVNNLGQNFGDQTSNATYGPSNDRVRHKKLHSVK